MTGIAAETRGRGKHVPQRTCIACRSTSAKRAFVRVVRSPDGHVQVDRTGKLSGRGAYLCERRSCWDAGLKRDRIANALKTTLTAEDRQALNEFAATLPADETDES